MTPYAIAAAILATVFVLPYRAREGKYWLGPLRFWLPLFCAYNLFSILVGRTVTERKQLLILAGASLCFVVGVGVGSARRRRSRKAFGVSSGDARSAPQPLAVSTPLRLVAGLLLLGWLPLSYLVATRGVPSLSGDVNAARVSFFPNGYFSTVVNACFDASIVMSALNMMAGRSNRAMKRRSVVIILIALLGLAVPGGRGTVAIPLLTVGLCYLWTHKARVRMVVVFGLLGLMLISYLGYQRAYQAYGSSYDRDLASAGFSGPLRFLAPGAEYVIGTSTTMDRTLSTFPSQIPYQLGREFFGPLLHKKSADLYLKDAFGLTFTGRGLAVGIMNAFYLDWGVFGVLIGFALFGWISGWLHRLALERGGTWALAYVLWLSQLILDNYAHPFAYLSVVVTPAVILGLTSRYRKATRGRPLNDGGALDSGMPMAVPRGRQAFEPAGRR